MKKLVLNKQTVKAIKNPSFQSERGLSRMFPTLGCKSKWCDSCCKTKYCKE